MSEANEPRARELLTIGMAAKRLPTISEPTLRDKITRGEVQAIRIAGRVFVTESELQRAFGSKYSPLRPA